LPGATQVTAQETLPLVPAGEYAISALQGNAACLPGATAVDFETRAAARTGAPPSDAEMSGVVGSGPLPFTVVKGQATYIRFDHAGCGTLLETGVIAIQVINDLDGDAERDAGEAGIAGWPLSVSGPDGEAALVTDANGLAHYSVVTGGAYLVRSGEASGWLATGDSSATVVAGLGETVHAAFFNQPRVAVSVSMTEISLSHPGGAPGIGWAFTLTGCGVTRGLETSATGAAQFGQLPPAAGCAYSVAVAERPGWATIAASKTAVPVGPGEVVFLSFVSVRIEVCQDCVPASPSAGGEPNPAIPVLQVFPGATLVTWPAGPSPIEDVFGAAEGVVAVYRWDEASGAWLKYFPGLPGYLNDLHLLEAGAVYWVVAHAAGSIPIPGPD
jgi:hypothetical protein